MPTKIGLYAKAVIAVALAVATSLGTALDNGNVSNAEWAIAAGAAVVAFGAVYAANLTIKWLVGAAVAFTAGLASAWEDGSIVPQEWTTIIAVTLVALTAIWAAPNALRSPPRSP